ncbi:MAG: hypothetical protein KGK07_02590 [Chloroflexota bacterium]|nr:hypothetical protein [Chloroflexota bacterium]
MWHYPADLYLDYLRRSDQRHCAWIHRRGRESMRRSRAAGPHSSDPTRGEGRIAAEQIAFPSVIALPVIVLALAGMLDLLFERIIYRIGIHVPKDASVMSAYQGATAIGDGAFRYVMVLAAFAAVAAALHLASSRQQDRRVIGAAILTLVVIDTMTIRWDDPHLGLAVNAVYGGALALLMGLAAGSARAWPFRVAALSAGLALLAGQYPLMAARAGDLTQSALPGVAAALTIAEAAVVATPIMLFIGAHPWRQGTGRTPLLIGSAAAIAVGAMWVRAPSTVAILSLWGTGVTMSFPAPVYVAALGAAVGAAVAFAREPGTRHLAVGMVLLLVAGVQPTVTQYNLAALIGMAILVLGPEASPLETAVSEERMEREAETSESTRIVMAAGSVVR